MEDFAKTAPAFGYSTKLNKIVFKNHEAFWMCVIAAEKQGMMSDVPFECDEDFLKHMVRKTGINKPTKKEIQTFLQGQLLEAMNVRDNIGDDHYKLFMVDHDNPNDIGQVRPIASKSLKNKSWSDTKERKLN